jgi:3-deoxy-manno-octulosonate cytidylyltransferase (CMP-KDO synthetase)
MNNLVVIPARYKSSRFPGKVLADLAGKPVVQHVYERCIQSLKAEQVFIATEDKQVYDRCKLFTNNVSLTLDTHLSGTDRVAEVVSKIDAVNIVNIQGDEPFISHKLIDLLFAELENSDAPMVTAFHVIESEKDLNNPNIVKVVTDAQSNAVYFSRLPIPFIRPPLKFENVVFKRHLGVYGYKANFLKEFVSMPESVLEHAEQLEQLRALESGAKIRLIETEYSSIGIDTPEDLEQAKKIMENKI